MIDEGLLEQVRSALKVSSQARFALRAGLDQAHISKIIRQKVPLTAKAARKLREALAVEEAPRPRKPTRLLDRVREIESAPDERLASALSAFLDILEGLVQEPHREGPGMMERDPEDS